MKRSFDPNRNAYDMHNSPEAQKHKMKWKKKKKLSILTTLRRAQCTKTKNKIEILRKTKIYLDFKGKQLMICRDLLHNNLVRVIVRCTRPEYNCKKYPSGYPVCKTVVKYVGNFLLF